MPTQEVALTIVQIGLATQFATTLLLVMLFALLRSQAQRRRYFVYWAWGWALLAVGLSALFVRFFFLGGPFGTGVVDGRTERAISAIYQFGKVGFLSGVLAGTLNYTRGIRPYWVFRVGLLVAAIYGLFCFQYVESLAATIVWQVPLTAMAYFGSAWVLLGLPLSRRSLGSRLTGLFLVLFGLVWLSYTLVFSSGSFPSLAGLAPVIQQVALYNSHIDLIMQMLLAFGMIMILLEDAKRETESAHAELAVAHQELKAESLRDSLTRALNRRAYNEGAGLEAARAAYGTVIVFDLDNLKDVNDSQGHQAGDALLKYFVEMLRPRLRPTDKLYRFGGDEFLLVMPRANKGEVVDRFRKLFDSVPAMNWEKGNARIKLRVSMGAASFEGGEDLDAAVTRADREMYEDKRQHKLFDG